jgi:glycyl-tRNA synthetase beta chain
MSVDKKAMNTADFLIEIGTEELPPKALSKLASSFHKNFIAGCTDARLEFNDSKWLATPRRLTLIVNRLSLQQPSKSNQKFGPAVDKAFDEDGNPTPAALGFARSCGVDISELEKLDTDKGVRLAYSEQQVGKEASELLPELVKNALKNLPIPKMMRWGSSREEFVRPVKWIAALLGDDVIEMTLFGKTSDRLTRGHRFHCTEDLSITNPASYEKLLLESGTVVVDFETRKQQILESVNQIVKPVGSAIIDQALLDEVTGLVEWPEAIIGSFEKEFLKVPEEALISSMQGHQKYFPVRDKDGNLSNHFITISNIKSNNPQAVVTGNEKVIRPRLADAKFFYDTDRKQSLAARIPSLEKVLFQKQLGTVADKSKRVAKLAAQIAPALDADAKHSARAAELAKCDLMSEMVGEFPNLQGIMGRYYALHDGEDSAVANALDEQYMPRFSGDQLPQSAVGATLAIAERMDTLCGLFGIGQPPKGAKDPFALRRATLGVIRILRERNCQMGISELIEYAMQGYQDSVLTAENTRELLLEFFYQRFNAWYQEQGIDANVIHAVMARRPEVVADFDARIKAIAHFQGLAESEALAAANKRVGNILSKQNVTSDLPFDESKLVDKAEKTLAKAISDLENKTAPLFEDNKYQQVMVELAKIRQPVDAFFDEVMVVVEDEAIKNNRFALLQRLRNLFLRVADISLLH